MRVASDDASFVDHSSSFHRYKLLLSQKMTLALLEGRVSNQDTHLEQLKKGSLDIAEGHFQSSLSAIAAWEKRVELLESELNALYATVNKLLENSQEMTSAISQNRELIREVEREIASR